MIGSSQLSGVAAIYGIGETPYSRRSGRTLEDLYVRIAIETAADAGLTPDAIDGLMMPAYTALPSGLLETLLGITPSFAALADVGGATCSSLVINAAAIVATGLARNVLCITARNDSTAGRGSNQVRSGAATTYVSGYDALRAPYGWMAAAPLYAVQARRHIERHGGPDTAEMGAVAVAMRKHAALNRHAQMKEPITLEDHANSRMIADPFRLLDCCVISDGAAGVLVGRTDQADGYRTTPIVLEGLAQGRPPSPADIPNRPVIDEIGTGSAGHKAFRMAGMDPGDIQVAELYDCFTYVVIKQLELLGFCAEGEGGAFVSGGRIELGGELPVNTHGGLLSQGHMSGMNHVVEAVRQLRGEASPAQVPSARTALVSGYGHFGDAAVLILTGAGG